nr:phospholipase-like protein [Tanacetum cinerariifolium]
MKLKEEEMLFKEEKIMEEDSRLRLEDKAKLMREEEKLLEDEQCSKIDYKKDEYALMNSESMKQVMARVVPKKRSHCTGVTSSTWLKVFIPLNEPGEHWCLAQFSIRSGLVTFYDNGDTYAIECREWYIRTMDCLE